MPKAIITGSSGLVGSECVRHFANLGWECHGIDNNARRDFFGPDGDTTPNLNRLRCQVDFHHYAIDIRDTLAVAKLFQEVGPDLVIHAAAQPSHDLAARKVFEDFGTNAVGTLVLLEACRQFSPACAFAFLSTNKVYGDAPNRIPIVEHHTRFAYLYPDFAGVDESCSIDQSTHSLFGVSKAAADLLVQEYGKYFGLKTVSFRCGCLTGGSHAAAELHGFLAYVVRCAREGRPYRIYGHNGKQVRDNLHAVDVATAIEQWAAEPTVGEVYNLGGGPANSCSVIEAIAIAENVTGKQITWELRDEPRVGDHIVYVTDTGKFRTDYPAWNVTRSLAGIFEELAHQQI